MIREQDTPTRISVCINCYNFLSSTMICTCIVTTKMASCVQACETASTRLKRSVDIIGGVQRDLYNIRMSASGNAKNGCTTFSASAPVAPHFILLLPLAANSHTIPNLPLPISSHWTISSSSAAFQYRDCCNNCGHQVYIIPIPNHSWQKVHLKDEYSDSVEGTW